MDAGKAADAASCAVACCAEATCDTWQFDVWSAQGCWVGAAPLGGCGESRLARGWRATRPVAANVPQCQRHASIRFGPSTAAARSVSHTAFCIRTSAGYRKLTLDAIEATGTGGALLLDGRDTAMVRAAVVDASSSNALVTAATHRIA